MNQEHTFSLSQTELERILKFFPKGIVSIDLETTGLSPLVDQIIEIAAVKITKDGVDIYQTLINPGIEIPAHTIAIHNITDAMVANSPNVKPCLLELQNFCEELPVVAHNAKFDAGFIVMGMQKNNLGLGKNNIYCSCKLSRFTHPEAENHKLATLVNHHGIELINHHRATDDAMASLRIFIKSLEKIDEIRTLNKNGFIFNYYDFIRTGKNDLPAHLKDLEKSVKEAAVVEILYAGGNYKNQWRPVKLTSLLNTPEGDILYARCLWSKMQKSFKIKKITDIRKPTASDIQNWLQKND